MNYYNEIKNKLIDNEIYQKVKDYSKERKNRINKQKNFTNKRRVYRKIL